MCCNKKANRHTQQAPLASTASGHPDHTKFSANPIQYAPHDLSVTQNAYLVPTTACGHRHHKSHCCSGRRHRGPLLWRLGKHLYTQAQQHRQDRQPQIVQEQGIANSVPMTNEGEGYRAPADSPPSYDRAMGSLEVEKEKERWADEKGI